MSFDRSDLPVFVRNVTDTDHKVGTVWFKAGSEVKINAPFYEKYSGRIYASINSGILELVGGSKEEEKPPKETNPPEPTVGIDDDDEGDKGDTSPPTDDSPTDDGASDVGNVVDEFVEGNLHWTHAVKRIESETDASVIESLIIDAKFHDLGDDSVIVRTLNKKLEELSQK